MSIQLKQLECSLNVEFIMFYHLRILYLFFDIVTVRVLLVSSEALAVRVLIKGLIIERRITNKESRRESVGDS